MCAQLNGSLLTLLVVAPVIFAEDDFFTVHDVPNNIFGRPLQLGAPIGGILGSELHPESTAYNTWAAKNESAFQEFITARAWYIKDDTAFSMFRRTADKLDFRVGDDAQYGKVHPDTGSMLAKMENSPWGIALLTGALPSVAPSLDGFGGPALIALGRHQAMSPDLFSGLFKISLLLESFAEFGAVPGQSKLPSVGDIYAGPSLVPLLMSWDVVEVGAGPGLFASTYVSVLNARTYTIVDLPTQQSMQFKVLIHALPEEKVESTMCFIPCCTRQLLGDYMLPSYDLFVSHSAMTELTSAMRERYFYAFVVRSKRGFIIDNYEDIHMERKGGLQEDGQVLRSGDGGKFTGLDLVWRLQDFGFDVHIRTHQELLGVVSHRSRAVVITWAATEQSEDMVRRLKASGGAGFNF